MGRIMEDMIRAEKLTFYYEQSNDGIRDINFSIKDSEIILLAGDSGSGKSTLLKCLNGLIPEIFILKTKNILSLGCLS